MSRGQREDLNRTIQEISNHSCYINGKNWLRHTGQASRIDEMLTTGATMQDIASDLIRSGLFTKSFDAALKRVNRHIVHLGKEEHQLPLTRERNGLWRFDIQEEDCPRELPIVEKVPISVSNDDDIKI